MGYGIFFKISGQIDLDVLITFILDKILISVTVFEFYAKNCNLPLCSIFSHGSHVVLRIKNPNDSFVPPMLVNNCPKFE